MKNLMFITTIFLLCNNFALSQEAKKIASIVLPSTVALIMEDSFHQPISMGSGFIISNGKIVTNLHVINGASYGKVFVNGNNIAHNIQGYFVIDEINDLAILAVPTVRGSVLPLLKEGLPEIGEKIYAIGNPKGLSGTISDGIISGIRTFDKKKLIQITAPISPGSSGGPVVNNNGQVVGVAVGTITDGQNLNFAIPSTNVNYLLSLCDNNIQPLSSNYIKAISQTNIKSINDGVIVKIPDDSQFILTELSIKNNLPYFISDIRIIVILYDENNEPTDYFEDIYCNSNKDEYDTQEPDPIRPNLTKELGLKKGMGFQQILFNQNPLKEG